MLIRRTVSSLPPGYERIFHLILSSGLGGQRVTSILKVDRGAIGVRVTGTCRHVTRFIGHQCGRNDVG